jgi:hypothetical protein
MVVDQFIDRLADGHPVDLKHRCQFTLIGNLIARDNLFVSDLLGKVLVDDLVFGRTHAVLGPERERCSAGFIKKSIISRARLKERILPDKFGGDNRQSGLLRVFLHPVGPLAMQFRGKT